MSSRAKSRATWFVFCCTLIAVWHSVVGGQEPPQSEAPPPVPAASSPPDLPPDVTLAQLVARKKQTCTFVGKKVIKRTDGPTYTAPLAEAMPTLLELTPTSLDAAAARPNAKPCLKSLCAFAKKVNCPNDVIEAVIRANCKEKIYRNCEIIDAAAKKCAPERIAKWRQLYPDN